MRRIPARTLADIELGDSAFRADFEITDKYQAFSSELLRLSLLGITGYGFLIAQIILKQSNPESFFNALGDYSFFLTLGISSLGLAAATSLAHRFFSTDCLSHQVTILRLLNRCASEKCTEDEKHNYQARLTKERTDQHTDLKVCKWLLICSAILLFIGAIAVVITFVGTLSAKI